MRFGAELLVPFFLSHVPCSGKHGFQIYLEDRESGLAEPITY